MYCMELLHVYYDYFIRICHEKMHIVYNLYSAPKTTCKPQLHWDALPDMEVLPSHLFDPFNSSNVKATFSKAQWH